MPAPAFGIKPKLLGLSIFHDFDTLAIGPLAYVLLVHKVLHIQYLEHKAGHIC